MQNKIYSKNQMMMRKGNNLMNTPDKLLKMTDKKKSFL